MTSTPASTPRPNASSPTVPRLSFTPRNRPVATPLRDRESLANATTHEDKAEILQESTKAAAEHLATITSLLPNFLEAEQCKKDGEALRDKLTSTEAEAQDRARELWSTRAELQTSKAELKEERDLTWQLRQNVGAAKDREAELLRKLQQMESQSQEIANGHEDMEKLKQQLADEQATSQELQQQVDQEREKVNQLQQESADAADQAVEKMEATVANINRAVTAEMEALRQEASTAQEEAQEAQAKLEALEPLAARSEKEWAAEQVKSATLEAKVKALQQTAVEDLEVERCRTAAFEARLKEVESREKEEIAEKEAQLVALREELEAERLTASEHRDENRALEIQLAAERDRAEEKEEDHAARIETVQDELQAHIQTLETQLKEEREHRECDEAQAVDQVAALDSLKAQLSDSQEEQARTKSELQDKEATVQELEATVTAATAETEHLMASLEDVRLESERFSAEVSLLREELEAQREINEISTQQEQEAVGMHEAVSSQLAEVEKQFAAKKEECKALKERLATTLAQGASEQQLRPRTGDSPPPSGSATARRAAQRSAQGGRLSTPPRTSARAATPPGPRSPARCGTSQGLRSPRQLSGTQAQDAEMQLAELQKELAMQKRARENAEERALQLEDDMNDWQRKAQELAADLESRQSSPPARHRGELKSAAPPTFDWTTYGTAEDLEELDDQARIHVLTVTSEQLRSHCHMLEVENTSMKDVMASFEMGLDETARLAGHVNHKQKIRYTLQLKDCINRLLEELRRSRQRIIMMEEGKVGDDFCESSAGRPWNGSVSTTTTTRHETRQIITVTPAPSHERAARRNSRH